MADDENKYIADAVEEAEQNEIPSDAEAVNDTESDEAALETAELEEDSIAEEGALPTSEQFEDELIRVKYKLRYRKLLKNTIYSLLIVAAISVLVATLFLPVLEIYGNSMNPTLESGDIVVSIKTTKLERGDVCCMYYNNHLLVKRVIGLQGDVIEMDEDGNAADFSCVNHFSILLREKMICV